MTDRDAKGRFIKGHSLGKRFEKGQESWLKGKKGYTNAGSFKEGHNPSEEVRNKISKSNKGIIRGSKGWICKTWGYKKFHINGRDVLEHHIIWKQHNQMPIPQGCVIHHRNGDKLNNKIENLCLLPRDIHARIHYNPDMRNGGVTDE